MPARKLKVLGVTRSFKAAGSPTHSFVGTEARRHGERKRRLCCTGSQANPIADSRAHGLASEGSEF
jgi:hypothetical protein